MMLDPLVLVLTILATVVSIVLVVVSIQAILVLQEIKKTLRHVNSLTETIEGVVNKTLAPLTNLGGMVVGLKTGMKMFETFATFVKRTAERENGN